MWPGGRNGRSEGVSGKNSATMQGQTATGRPPGQRTGGRAWMFDQS
jgi:hypothetical protein